MEADNEVYQDAVSQIIRGHGSPEGEVAAVVGAIYIDLHGGPGRVLYIKESGVGITGWSRAVTQKARKK